MKKKLVAGLCMALMIVAFGLSGAEASPVYFGGTGHYYDFIPGSFTWDNAKLDAAGKSYNGAAGYLATITSQAEDTFIRQTFSNVVGQWVGPWFGADWDGSGGGPTTGWHWVTGETFLYTGWNGGEPNHLGGEDAIHFSGGGWNDIHRSRLDAVGYLIEYNAPTVPEPMTLLLLGLGMAGVAGVKRKV